MRYTVNSEKVDRATEKRPAVRIWEFSFLTEYIITKVSGRDASPLIG